MGLFEVFGFGKKKKRLAGLLDRKALIIDVRTVPEYHAGHVPASINIPLHTLDSHIKKILKTKRPVITCCRTGRRSGIAATSLKRKGIDSENGGNWKSLNKLVLANKMEL